MVGVDRWQRFAELGLAIDTGSGRFARFAGNRASGGGNMRRLSLLVFFVLIASAIPAMAQSTETVVVDIDGVARGGEGTEALVGQASSPDDYPAELVGRSCDGRVETRNNESVHDGNVLVIRTGDSVAEVEDYEASPDATTITFGTLILGETIDVFVRFGEDGVTSGGASVVFDCPPPPGRIIVVKAFDVDGDGTADPLPDGESSPDFGFEPSYQDPFNLRIGESSDSGDLPAGAYSVIESPEVFETEDFEWSFVTATCSDGSTPSAIALQSGEIVTCTFLNTRVSVGGIQVTTTTAPASTTTAPTATTTGVSPSTLPFTGAGSGTLAAFGTLFLVAGVLAIVGADRRRREQR